MELDAWGIKGKIVFTPGHTAGSISVVIEDEDYDLNKCNNQAIAGDLMKGGHLGGALYPNRPDYHYFADDLDIVRDSIKKLMSFSISKVYLGHGGPLDRKDIKRRFSRDISF